MPKTRISVQPVKGTLLASLLEELSIKLNSTPYEIALLGACQVLLLYHKDGKIKDLEEFAINLASFYRDCPVKKC